MRRAMRAEIAILGAGPVGCILSLLLSRQDNAVVLERKSKTAPDSLRPIVLSHASRLILERVGAWQRLAPTPVERIHISQQGGFGRTELLAADAGVPALGYVLEYGVLLDALLGLVAERKIPIAPAPAGALLTVHAEGTSDAATRKDYGQDAVVALVSTRPAALATALERFTPEGPLALLPLGGRVAAVWGMHPEGARQL